jgi:hypothetical protein
LLFLHRFIAVALLDFGRGAGWSCCRIASIATDASWAFALLDAAEFFNYYMSL